MVIQKQLQIYKAKITNKTEVKFIHIIVRVNAFPSLTNKTKQRVKQQSVDDLKTQLTNKT